MAKVRSPNYPVADLTAALGWARLAFDKDHRNKMSRLTLARHMGHESLSGPALGKLGTLRAYGLIDGSGDDLRVTDDALTALVAPESSPDRASALAKLAIKPNLFGEIRKEFPGAVSDDNLRYWLVKHGYTEDAAKKATRVYLANLALVGTNQPGYSEEVEDDGDPDVKKNPPPPPPPPSKERMRPMDGERELKTGMLSKDGASFRLLVTGQIGVKEIDRLIRQLEFDKEILAEPDEPEAGNEPLTD